MLVSQCVARSDGIPIKGLVLKILLHHSWPVGFLKGVVWGDVHAPLLH